MKCSSKAASFKCDGLHTSVINSKLKMIQRKLCNEGHEDLNLGKL